MFSLAILTLSEPPVDDPMARISFEKKFQVMAYLRNMLTKIGLKNKLRIMATGGAERRHRVRSQLSKKRINAPMVVVKC
jgi:hypothetical protein